jgi:hypothetical protein
MIIASTLDELVVYLGHAQPSERVLQIQNGDAG